MKNSVNENGEENKIFLWFRDQKLFYFITMILKIKQKYGERKYIEWEYYICKERISKNSVMVKK